MNIININLRKNGNLAYGNNPEKIVLHHAEAVKCSIEDINAWHLERGWTMCGYHYFVRKDGTIYKGRPDNAMGAHCPGQNSISLAICAEGSYHTIEKTMPELQRKAIVELCKYLCRQYGIKEIFKHRSLHPTNCPGDYYPFDVIIKEVFSTNTMPSNANLVNPIKPNSPQQVKTWLQVGDSGVKVKDLQEKLKKLGISIVADGIFGQQTKQIIINFQKKYNLIIDGLAGKEVFTKIEELLNDTQRSWLQVGDNGSKVKDLQEKLKKLGYKIDVDGIYGKQTKSAVYQFQEKYKLVEDGLAGKKVFDKLNQLVK